MNAHFGGSRLEKDSILYMRVVPEVQSDEILNFWSEKMMWALVGIFSVNSPQENGLKFRHHPDLPFLAFLEFLAFFLSKEFLVFFFSIFPSFPGILGVG